MILSNEVNSTQTENVPPSSRAGERKTQPAPTLASPPVRKPPPPPKAGIPKEKEEREISEAPLKSFQSLKVSQSLRRPLPPFVPPYVAPGELPGELTKSQGKTCRIPPNRRLRILTIDGGGARGLIPSIVVDELEKRLELPISKIMDAFGGTSVGGIMVLGYNVPESIRDGRVGSTPLYTAHKVSEEIIDLGGIIFDERKLGKLKNVLKRGARYKSEGLEKVLSKFFGEVLVSQSIKPVYVTTFDLNSQAPFVISTALANLGNKGQQLQNTKLPSNSPEPEGVQTHSIGSPTDVTKHEWPFARLMMRAAVQATTAAPTYFPLFPYELDNRGTKMQLVDGGVGLNNPSVIVLREIDKEYCTHPSVFLIALGTGKSRTDFKDISKKRKGPLKMIWPAILGYSETQEIEANAAVNHDISLRNMAMSNTHSYKSYYKRFQVLLDEGKDKMDDTSPEMLKYWLSKGLEIVKPVPGTFNPEFEEVILELRQDLCEDLTYCREENYAGKQGLHGKMCPQSRVDCTQGLKKSLIQNRGGGD
jgi:patatin-like phospholipase/acyl hydrolase